MKIKNKNIDRVLTPQEIKEEFIYKLQLGEIHSKTLDEYDKNQIKNINIPKKIKIKKVKQ